MQVTFQINQTQLCKALEIAAANLEYYRLIAETADHQRMSKATFSPLLGMKEPHEGDDTLELVGLHLIYKGTREELHQGGVVGLIARICGQNPEAIKPFFYAPDSGDEAKRWFEE